MGFTGQGFTGDRRVTGKTVIDERVVSDEGLQVRGVSQVKGVSQVGVVTGYRGLQGRGVSRVRGLSHMRVSQVRRVSREWVTGEGIQVRRGLQVRGVSSWTKQRHK